MLTKDFTFCHVAGDIEQLDLIDGFEIRVIGELPDDFLLSGNLKKLRLFTKVTVSEVVAEDSIATRKSLASGHEPERVAGKLVFIQFPNDFFIWVEFHDFVAVPTGDKQVPVG